jgi:hypothetical protein
MDIEGFGDLPDGISRQHPNPTGMVAAGEGSDESSSARSVRSRDVRKKLTGRQPLDPLSTSISY